MPRPDIEALKPRLADALRSLRKDQSLTVYEVAERMGKRRDAATLVSRWERGETVPASTQLWVYLLAIGCNFADLERKLNPAPARNRRLEEIARELRAIATDNDAVRDS